MGLPRLPLALALVAAVAAAVVAALLVVGGPGTARLERYDQRRVQDVAELVNAIERHRIFSSRLPETLEALRAGPSGPPPIRDPATGALYEYEPLDEGRFRVCTLLAVPGSPPPMPGPVRMADSRRIAHVQPVADGRLCWESADPPG